ncbi:MAG TPA: hypothetical protein VFQ88_05220 [Nevskiaceae bacterium]|nr:hypothetical protein [Nevskiaceae bacterium]
MTLMLVLTLVVILLGLFVLEELWRLRRQYRALGAPLETAAGLTVDAADDSFISVRILNPFELAANDNRLARPLIALAPGVIRRIVYRRTMQTMVAQLQERGVRADVNIHFAEPSDGA